MDLLALIPIVISNISYYILYHVYLGENKYNVPHSCYTMPVWVIYKYVNIAPGTLTHVSKYG